MHVFGIFLAFFLALFAVHAAPVDEANTTIEHSLVARDDFIGNQCGPSELSWGDCAALKEGLQFLDSRGPIYIKARSKPRVSCSWNTGIYYENNEHFDVDVFGTEIADQVRHLVGLCDDACVPGLQTFSGIGIYSAHRIIVTGTQAFGQKC